MRKWTSLLGGLAAVAAALSFVFAVASFKAAAQTWQAVNPEIPVGKNVRLELRLAGVDGKPIAGPVTVKSTRLDMGPDGMGSMTTRVQPVVATAPGTVAFDTDIPMAGRWAFSISATVPGQSKPVSGVVVLTAVEKRSEAAPAAAQTQAVQAERKVLFYRNPMGLPDTSPVPKKDWMGMDYIPVYADEANDPPGTVRISPAKVQRAGVRTEEVTRRTLSRTVRAVGTIEADESRLAVVTARFGGFVEELFVPVTGATVRMGAPLLRVWIESTDILQKQSDLLTALRGGRPEDVDRTTRNLRLFGIPDPVIARVRETREPVRSIVLTAPADGTVMQKPALVGMRFAPGDALFKTADLSKVWVMAQVAERDLGLVRVGQTACIKVKAYADAPREGRVGFIYPELNMATRTALVRIELGNVDGLLKAGLYADVEIDTPSESPVLAIPESAIIDSGSRRVVFVAKGDGVFEPRDLVVGRRGNGLAEVRGGLSEGERIVVTGNFLIDAESNLRAALATFTAAPAAQ